MTVTKVKHHRKRGNSLTMLQSEKIEVAIQTFWLCYEGKNRPIWPEEVMDLTVYILYVLQGKR